MTHVPAESKAWPRAGANEQPSPSGEQAGRVGQPVRETSAAAREPRRDPEHDRLRAEHARRCDEDYRAFRQERFAREFEDFRRGLQASPRADGDGAVQDLPRSPAQRTD